MNDGAMADRDTVLAWMASEGKGYRLAARHFGLVEGTVKSWEKRSKEAASRPVPTGPPTPAAVFVPLSALTPWTRNPRRNDGRPAEAVRASIIRWGWGNPILARPDGEVIAGHTRLKAAATLPREWLHAQEADRARWHPDAVRLATDPSPSVPVRYMDLTADEAHALAVADNRIGELADWSDDLGEVLRDLGGRIELGDLGWDAGELEAVINPPAGPNNTPDPGPPEVESGPAHSQVGEVYELGPHRLMCGDCRDPEVVSRLLAGRKVNVAFTSPPYASQREYDVTSGFRPIPADEYVEWFAAVQACVRAHLAEDGSWFVNIKEHSEDGQRSLYVKDLVIAHVRRWGWRLGDELCWLRQSLPGDPNSMRKFKNGFEPVFHFAVGEFKFRPDAVRHESETAFTYDDQKAAGRDISAASQGKGSNAQSPVGQGRGLAYPSNVLDIKQGAKVVGHAAAFPVALPEFFIRAYSDPADAIYDPFMGSGSTLMAAHRNGRIAYGCEISARYCDVIRRRWTTFAREAGIDPGPGALD